MELGKYDVMSKKMNKFSDIVNSFIGRYIVSITKKKKIDTIKIFLDKVLIDTHILLEIKKDLEEYSSRNKLNINMFNFSKSLNDTSKQLEKILLMYLICKQKNEEFIYECFIESISKKASFNDIIRKISNNLEGKDKQILTFVNSDDYDFNMLPKEYQTLILKDHENYMNKNINTLVNKEEQDKIKILKGIKIYKENVDINLSLELDTYKTGKQKIKD